jgi:hypothetical protein
MDRAVGVHGAAANHFGWVHRGKMANNFTDKANFIWTVADLIRDDFKRGKYQDIILLLTVLRRIDGVLEPTKDKVLGEYEKYKDKLKDIDPILRKASGYAFYNTSRFTFARLLNDPDNLAKNLNAYINGFSQNMREVIDHFDFRNTIAKLDAANLLYLVMQRFNEIDLRPDVVDNHEMGTIFEELIRRFNDALDENPGEHFTPREVVNLMVMLLFAVENDILQVPQRVVKFADPACGKGKIQLKRKTSELDPDTVGQPGGLPEAEMEVLSEIIKKLNERFSTEFSEEDRLVIHQIEQKLSQDDRLGQTLRVNTPENAILAFRQVLQELFQDMLETNFKFYQNMDNNPDFAERLTAILFERYRQSMENGVAG